MPLPASGDLRVNLAGFEARQIVLRAVAGIGRDLLGLRPEVARDLLDQPHQIRAIAGLALLGFGQMVGMCQVLRGQGEFADGGSDVGVEA
jgi:hypothetical protein